VAAFLDFFVNSCTIAEIVDNSLGSQAVTPARDGGDGGRTTNLGNRSRIMLAENKQLVRRYYEQVMGDLGAIEELVAPGFVDHHFPPDTPPGPAGVREFFIAFARSVFGDMRIEIDFLLAEGDKVDCHFVFHARHIGPFAGIEPRGNPIRLPAISTFRIADGRLAEAWEIFDSASLLQQMRGERG
jgi:predicted ester cyclase